MNTASRIRVGLIGCGTIAWWQHLRNLQRLRGARVTALADPDPAALERAARRVDAARCPDANTLLSRDDVDAVVIASPVSLHADHFEAACAAGKHVYVEKPLAHDAATLARAEACAGPKVVAVGYNFRFHPGLRRLRDELTAGSIGTARAVVSHFTETVDPAAWPEWRRTRAEGGGVLLDLASHHFDLYRWLLQDELGGMAAEIRASDSAENRVRVHGASRGGVDVAGYFAHGGARSHAFAVHGTAGVLQLDVHTGRLSIQRPRRRGYGVTMRPLVPDMRWLARKRLQPSFDPSHALAIRAFIEAVAAPASRDPDLAGLSDGIAALKVVLEIENGQGASGAGRIAAGPV